MDFLMSGDIEDEFPGGQREFVLAGAALLGVHENEHDSADQLDPFLNRRPKQFPGPAFLTGDYFGPSSDGDFDDGSMDVEDDDDEDFRVSRFYPPWRTGCFARPHGTVCGFRRNSKVMLQSSAGKVRIVRRSWKVDVSAGVGRQHRIAPPPVLHLSEAALIVKIPLARYGPCCALFSDESKLRDELEIMHCWRNLRSNVLLITFEIFCVGYIRATGDSARHGRCYETGSTPQDHEVVWVTPPANRQSYCSKREVGKVVQQNGLFVVPVVFSLREMVKGKANVADPRKFGLQCPSNPVFRLDVTARFIESDRGLGSVVDRVDLSLFYMRNYYQRRQLRNLRVDEAKFVNIRNRRAACRPDERWSCKCGFCGSQE